MFLTLFWPWSTAYFDYVLDSVLTMVSWRRASTTFFTLFWSGMVYTVFWPCSLFWPCHGFTESWLCSWLCSDHGLPSLGYVLQTLFLRLRFNCFERDTVCRIYKADLGFRTTEKLWEKVRDDTVCFCVVLKFCLSVFFQ